MMLASIDAFVQFLAGGELGVALDVTHVAIGKVRVVKPEAKSVADVLNDFDGFAAVQIAAFGNDDAVMKSQHAVFGESPREAHGADV